MSRYPKALTEVARVKSLSGNIDVAEAGYPAELVFNFDNKFSWFTSKSPPNLRWFRFHADFSHQMPSAFFFGKVNCATA